MARMALRVDATGAVEHIGILEESGFTALDAAALAAVSQWRFRPAVRDGRPLPTTIGTIVQFRLQDSLQAGAPGRSR